jgi:hypothetical protein
MDIYNGKLYTGVEFAADFLGIPEQDFKAAFSFYSGEKSNSNIYPEPWATGSATGVLVNNNWGKVFKSGAIDFDGDSSLMYFTNGYVPNRDFSLTNSTIFLSFQRNRSDDEILMSSIQGTNPFFSGFCLGVNAANKLYFKYWNTVDQVYTFTYEKILSNKNLILLNRTQSNIALGRFNNNTQEFDYEYFDIYKNNCIDSSTLYLGGYYSTGVLNLSQSQQIARAPWAFAGSKNFSGRVDKFYNIFNMPMIYANQIARAMYSNFNGYAGYTEQICYTTGYISNSGSYTTGVTGSYFSGFTSGFTGVTGYNEYLSGYSYTGFTGFYSVTVGYYYDLCKISHPIIKTYPGSGLITEYKNIKEPLTGLIFITGGETIDLTGDIWNPESVYVTGTVCDDIFRVTGDIVYDIDKDYLQSLSYSQISVLSPSLTGKYIKSGEFFAEDYSPTALIYNANMPYDAYSNKFLANNIITGTVSGSGISVFTDKNSHIISSGYSLYSIEYDNYISPNLDYSIFENYLYLNTGSKYSGISGIFYDNFTGSTQTIRKDSYTVGSILGRFTGIGSGVSGGFLYRNDKKLTYGLDYFVNSLNGDVYLTANNSSPNTYYTCRLHPKFTYKLFNSGSIGTESGFNNGTSMLFITGNRQRLNIDYCENSNFDLISGIFMEAPLKQLILDKNENRFFNI